MNAPPGHDPPDLRKRNSNRRMLLAVVAVFLVPIVVALLLNAGHLVPAAKTKGELLKPLVDLRDIQPELADGSAYRWDPSTRRWRILVAPPVDCTAACVEAARKIDLVWQLLGKHAEHVDILWLGTPPADARRNAATRILRRAPELRDKLPHADGVPGEGSGVPVYVIDPNGFVVLRYAPGFAPKDLLDDVTKLAKLM